MRERPEVLLRAAQTLTETGPLEALMAEMDFNRVAAVQNIRDSCPPLSVEQFHRAVATNSLAALTPDVRKAVHQVYVLIKRINYHLDEMAHMDRFAARENLYTAAQAECNRLRVQVPQTISEALRGLEAALGLREE